MISIRIRITILTLTAILVSVLAIGVVSLVSIRGEGERSSNQTMRLLCDNCRYSIDDYLSSIERSVEIVSRYALDELSSVELMEGGVIGTDGILDGAVHTQAVTEQQQRLDDYLFTYTQRVENIFRSVANHTNGVVSFYYRLSPEISMVSKGFLYTCGNEYSFSEKPLTRLENFEQDDVSHVGWYYIPIERGRPSWIEPYDNRNLGVQMISFVTPLYKAGTFIGVIGMDISYETLISRIKDIRIYQSGYAFLVDSEGMVIYHPSIREGTMLSSFGPQLEAAVERLGREKDSDTPLVYTLDGESRLAYFTTLASGLKLMVTVPVRELSANTLQLGRMILLLSLLIATSFVLIAVLMMNRVTKPLRRLTEASERLSEGYYDVQLDYDRDDEVGKLTHAFQKLVEHLDVYISDLNSRAYQDAMTGVRNKGAYALSARKLDDAIHAAAPDEPAEFALAMFDCNNLKLINDTYGHEKGDEYLCASCRLICSVFSHCPVFRIGGDEFVVIIQGESYRVRQELLDVFDARLMETAVKEKPWQQLRIAKGVAVYAPAQDDNSESVLKRADAMMYEDKRRSKAELARQ